MNSETKRHVSCDSLPNFKSERSFGQPSSRRDLLGTLKSSLAECTSRNAQKERKVSYLKTLLHDLKAENAARKVPLTSEYTKQLATIAAKTEDCQEEANKLEYAHLKAQQSLVSPTQSVAKHRLREVELLSQRQNQHYPAVLEAAAAARQLSDQASFRLSVSLQEAEAASKEQANSLSAQRQTQKATEWQTYQNAHRMYLLQKHEEETLQTRRKLGNWLELQEFERKQWKAEKQQSEGRLEDYERGLGRIGRLEKGVEVSPDGLRLAASRLKGCAKAESALQLQYEELASVLAHRRKTCAEVHMALYTLKQANPPQSTPSCSTQGRELAQHSKVQASEAALSFHLDESALKLYGQILAFAERVLALVKSRRPADARMQTVHLEQVLNFVLKVPNKELAEVKRLRRRSSYRSSLECEDDSAIHSFANLASHCQSIFPCDHPYCDFAIHTMSTVTLTQDPILRFSLQLNQRPFFTFEPTDPRDFLRCAFSRSHAQFRAVVLQICEALTRLVTALHFGDLARAPNSPENAVWYKRNLKQRTSTEKSSFALATCSEPVIGEVQGVGVFVTQKEGEKVLEAQQENIELEEVQFYKAQRVQAHMFSAAAGPNTCTKTKEKRPFSQETHFQGYLRHLNAVGKSLRTLRVKKRLTTGKSLGDSSVSLHHLGSPSHHPTKSASVSFSGSTTASRGQPRA